jgi:NAD(P)-dependent dehydrogenase (short-subunit alcohol dehydrogenase family)
MDSHMGLKGKTILVTGASSGIGKQTAITLSILGARLVLVARDISRLKETASQMNHSNHHIIPFDLNNTDEIPHWMMSISEDIGPLDGLVHSAGIVQLQPLRYLKQNDLESLMRINLFAAMALAKGYRQRGVCNKGGSIVFLSSVRGISGEAGVAAYAASKGALISMTKSLAVELAPEKIRINCVAPGLVQTEMVNNDKQLPAQLERMEQQHLLGIGTPEDVANAIAFLLADTGKWITGTTLVVDGGYTAH